MTRVDLSIVFVNYRSSAPLAAALASWQRDVAGLGLACEWLVVDNGDDPQGRQRLAGLPASLLTPASNLGYAGGANFGLAVARGQLLAVANPDLLILPGATRALLAAVVDYPIVGPRFYWDASRRLLLPPTERWTPMGELIGLAARRGGVSARRARRRWRRHARRSWRTVVPLASHDLPGALLLFQRQSWEQLGPFDEGYQLYFEETDWLARACHAGVRAAHVPAAEVVHLHAHSTGQEGAASSWFAASADRFRRRWYPPAAVERLAAAAARERPTAPAARLPPTAEPPRDEDWWVEVSPAAAGFPAAAERLSGPCSWAELAATWRLPADVAARTGSRLEARLSDSAGREWAAWTVEPGEARR